MAGRPAHLPHFNKINCGNQSGPTQTNASCCIRLDRSLAISRSIPNMRKLASLGHPLDGCFPTPSIKARFRSISSHRNEVWRSAFVGSSRGLLLGLQAVIYALDSAQFLLHAAAKAEFGSPILSVKGESPKTWYSVSRNARIVSRSIRDSENTKPSRMEGRRRFRLVAPLGSHIRFRVHLARLAGWHGRRPIS